MGDSTSDQRHDLPLRLGVACDVALGRRKARVAGELLDIAQRAAGLDDLPSRTRDEGPAPAVRAGASEAEPAVKPPEPDLHGGSAVAVAAVQCGMARIALDWGVRDLAANANVSTDTVSRFERGEELKASTVDALRSTLEAGGVEFIPENGGGPGVRLAKRKAKRR